MGSFFKEVGDVVKQTVWDQPVGIAKDVVKGDFGGAFDQFKSTFGDNNRELSDVFNKVGIRGKVGDNPQEAIGAVVGTVLGGWMAAPAVGAGGAAAGGAGAGALAGGASALSYAPTMSAVLGGSGATTGTSALGTLGWTGGTAGTLGSSIGTGASAFAPAAGSAMAYMPTQSAVLGGSGSGSSTGASTFDTIMNQLGNMPKQQQEEQKQQPMQLSKPTGGYRPIQPFGYKP